MLASEFDSIEVLNKLNSHMKKLLVDGTLEKSAYMVSVFDRFIEHIKSYVSYKDIHRLGSDLLAEFPISDIPEINKRQLVKTELDRIEGLDSFKKYLDEIGF